MRKLSMISWLLGFVDHLPQTFFQGIDRLMPGESMIYNLSQGTMEKFRWYDLDQEVACDGEDYRKRMRQKGYESSSRTVCATVSSPMCLWAPA